MSDTSRAYMDLEVGQTVVMGEGDDAFRVTVLAKKGRWARLRVEAPADRPIRVESTVQAVAAHR